MPAAPAASRCLQKEKKCTCKVLAEVFKAPALWSDTIKDVLYQWMHRWRICTLLCFSQLKRSSSRTRLLCCSFFYRNKVNPPISPSQWSEITSADASCQCQICLLAERWQVTVAAIPAKEVFNSATFSFLAFSNVPFVNFNPVPASFSFTQNQQISDFHNLASTECVGVKLTVF